MKRPIDTDVSLLHDLWSVHTCIPTQLPNGRRQNKQLATNQTALKISLDLWFLEEKENWTGLIWANIIENTTFIPLDIIINQSKVSV